MNTEVAVRQSLDELERMANAIAKSGLFGIKNPLEALALMLIAQSEGQHPATIAQDYDIIQGRAARKTHSVLARFQSAGGKVKWIELTDTCAKATFSHPDGGELTIDWTIERAKKTMVWNGKKEKFEALADRGMYQNYPRAMLRARCIAEGIRAVYPGAIGGMLVEEEARDAEPLDMGQAVVVEQPKAKPKAAAQGIGTAGADAGPTSAPAAAAPKTASPPPATPLAGASTPSGTAVDAVPSSAPLTSDPGAQAERAKPASPAGGGEGTAGPLEGELLPREREAPTLTDCLALADQACEEKRLRELLPTLAEYRKSLSAEDQATLDSTLAALLADQEPAKPAGPPLSAGQKRILSARLKSNGKSLESFEAKFGPMDSVPAASWDAVQAWASA